ncbi:hypothetical protein [Piscirickettsia salmonis]|uniref:hypothetical protein n=1 Tax=Piscirickettsia salmonis TaxID=1238 RepID=UPI001E285592|nr:hypothetical protein [Piscirickettsia salmonis]
MAGQLPGVLGLFVEATHKVYPEGGEILLIKHLIIQRDVLMDKHLKASHVHIIQLAL